MSSSDRTTPVSETDPGRTGVAPPFWRDPRYLVIAILVLGVFFRFSHYIGNRSLWLDEAMLSLNILQRSYSELFEPLDRHQVAPVGFLVIEKFFSERFGGTEYGLRLLPFLCGVASLLFFYPISKAVAGRARAIVGLALLSTSYWAIYYSAEVKQYGPDLAVTCLLYALCLPYFAGRTRSSLIGLLLAGSACVWFSHPSTFVLAAIGITLGGSALLRRNWPRLGAITVISLVWLGSFAISLALTSSTPGSDAFQEMRTGWGHVDGYVPASGLRDTIRWLVFYSLDLFENPFGFQLEGLAAFAFLLGAIALWKENREWFFLLGLSFAVTILVSAFRYYPFHTRLLLFLLPTALVFIATGTLWLYRSPDSRLKTVSIILTAALLTRSTYNAVAMSRYDSPYEKEELRPVLEHVVETGARDDRLFVFFHAQPAFDYYRERLGLGSFETIRETTSRRNLSLHLPELERLRGKGRVWLIGTERSLPSSDSRRFLFSQVERWGRELDSATGHKTFAILYDFGSEPPESR